MSSNPVVYSPHNPMRPHHKPGAVQHGVSHMTAASRQIHALGFGSGGATRTRRKKRASPKTHHKATHRRPRVSAARSGRSKFVKGSAAARRHMAQLRAMRGKKKAAA